MKYEHMLDGRHTLDEICARRMRSAAEVRLELGTSGQSVVIISK
jgi:hypothetical protein